MLVSGVLESEDLTLLSPLAVAFSLCAAVSVLADAELTSPFAELLALVRAVT